MAARVTVNDGAVSWPTEVGRYKKNTWIFPICGNCQPHDPIVLIIRCFLLTFYLYWTQIYYFCSRISGSQITTLQI
jgi:hypothetical protein